eukprot:c19143_g1_i3.p1 GENE.c19143_g1_i3~~c19143_g1_i3.p1  ORF type:complete len:139 (+),score=17.92 c19143_g1_i3:198-614(+)
MPKYECINMIQRSILHWSVPAPHLCPSSFRARLAVTEFNLTQVNHSTRTAMFVATLHTGRTHQLRVHFSESAFPIINDKHYNRKPRRLWPAEAATPDSPRELQMGLQAFRIRMPNPTKPKEMIDISLPLPEEWKPLLG